MDGNHSLLAIVSHQVHYTDVQVPTIINIILGLPANMCVTWLILTGPGNKAAEIFLLNQAICEVSICMTHIISLIGINTAMSNAENKIYLGFSTGLLFSGRPLFTSCVCFERYLAVVHPVTFLKYKLLRYRLAGAIICWLTVLAFCIILIWVPHPAIYYVCFGMAFTWFLVQFFSCVATLCTLLRPGPGDGTQESNGMNSAKLKAFRIIILIIVAAALTYLPYVISIILHGQSSKEDSSRMFCVAAYMALVTGFIPPLLYLHRAGKLQHCMKNIGNMPPNA